MQTCKAYYEAPDGRIRETDWPAARYVLLTAGYRVAIFWSAGDSTRSYNLTAASLWRLQKTLARHGRIIRQNGQGSTWMIGGDQ